MQAEKMSSDTLASSLNNPTLFEQRCFIDGQWLEAEDGAVVEVTNPVDGSVIGVVPKMGAAETERAIAAAEKAFPLWHKKTAKERATLMRKWYELIMENLEDLAVIMTTEQGKPLMESRGEVAYAASFIEWFAEEGKRVYGDVIPEHLPDYRVLVEKKPVGVTAAITPWNFPAAMITRKVGPALGAGCTSIVKPATQTPYSALALAKLAEEAGIPAGVVNVVVGDTRAIGGALTASPVVRKLSFTGSTEVGKLLMEQSAPTLKKLSLELGGNAPFIVFDDADVDAAVEGAVASKYRNSGQTCVCTNRFLVQEGIYDAFAEAFAKKVATLQVGNGLEDGVQQGPLIDAPAVQKVEELLADAEGKGAEIVLGGKRHALGGQFFEPTVLRGATTAMRFAKEEIFGPVAPLFSFSTEEEAIQMANDTEFGLAAYAYTRDAGRIFRTSRALEYGMVAVNAGILSTEVAPFGGVKESGFGREGSHYGIEEYVDTQYICLHLPEAKGA